MTYFQFYKYQGAGNDFIMIDYSTNPNFPIDDYDYIQRLCNRRFGVGADGLIVLRSKENYDFEMLYYNADGRPGSMCGNGGRCIIAFAHFLGLISLECQFLASDGPHRGKFSPKWIELEMQPVENIEKGPDFYFIDTGSPHYIEFVDDLNQVEVYERGKAIRYNERFKEKGTNVNFVQPTKEGIKVATYERGVEAETLACGTGVTAAAIGYHLNNFTGNGEFTTDIQVKGGQLQVKFLATNDRFDNIWLCGPAEQVFRGFHPL